jgi:tetratricopeptide (TPR) repeat protein
MPWARKGQVLRRMDRHEEALEAYENALQLDPRYAWAWNGKGLAYAALDRWPEALECYEQAVKHDDASDVWFLHNQGAALIELERYVEAIHVLDQALETDPQHEPSRSKRMEARKKRHHVGEDES